MFFEQNGQRGTPGPFGPVPQLGDVQPAGTRVGTALPRRHRREVEHQRPGEVGHARVERVEHLVQHQPHQHQDQAGQRPAPGAYAATEYVRMTTGTNPPRPSDAPAASTCTLVTPNAARIAPNGQIRRTATRAVDMTNLDVPAAGVPATPGTPTRRSAASSAPWR